MLVLPLLGILFRHYILKLANSYFNEIDMKDMRKKLKELSQKYKISRERVRQIREKALQKLREPDKNKRLKTFCAN